MQERIEDFFGDIDKVCDNNDFGDFMWEGGLVNTASNSKEFSLRDHNVDHMVEGFDYRFVMDMNVYYRWHNIVLDTSISYHKSIGQRVGEFNNKSIELLNVWFEGTVTTFTKKIERKLVRKTVNNSVTRLEFGIGRIKQGKNFIEPIIHIDNVVFDEAMLLLS